MLVSSRALGLGDLALLHTASLRVLHLLVGCREKRVSCGQVRLSQPKMELWAERIVRTHRLRKSRRPRPARWPLLRGSSCARRRGRAGVRIPHNGLTGRTRIKDHRLDARQVTLTIYTCDSNTHHLGLDDIAEPEALAHLDLVALCQTWDQYLLQVSPATHRTSAMRTTPVSSSVESATGRLLTTWMTMCACCGERRDT